MGWLNGLDGVYTLQSCAGHEDSDAHIWLRLNPVMTGRMRELAPLLVEQVGVLSVSQVWGRDWFPVWEVTIASHKQWPDRFEQGCEQVTQSLERTDWGGPAGRIDGSGKVKADETK